MNAHLGDFSIANHIVDYRSIAVGHLGFKDSLAMCDRNYRVHVTPRVLITLIRINWELNLIISANRIQFMGPDISF